MVNGVPQVRAMLKRKGAAVVAAGRAAARQGGAEVADAMRFLAPVQPGPEGGDLRRSIRVEDAASISSGGAEREFIGVVIRAGDATTVVTNSRGQQFQNARIQEFGTKARPANPYFFPAWRANRARIRASITRAIRKAWISG